MIHIKKLSNLSKKLVSPKNCCNFAPRL